MLGATWRRLSLQGLQLGKQRIFPSAGGDFFPHTQDGRLGTGANSQDSDPSIRAAVAVCSRDSLGRFAAFLDTSAVVEPFDTLIWSSRLDPASVEPA
jgi:hypothetical protein